MGSQLLGGGAWLEEVGDSEGYIFVPGFSPSLTMMVSLASGPKLQRL
jgi:hypothetical protein